MLKDKYLCDGINNYDIRVRIPSMLATSAIAFAALLGPDWLEDDRQILRLQI